jgi:hypothetical protein
VVDSPRRFINLRIDEAWLDQTLDRLRPGSQFEGLLPALNFIYMQVPVEAHGFPAWAEAQEKMRFIARRILPPEGDTCISPLLVCPECDFLDCTVVVAEITNAGSVVRWDRLGVDRTRSWVEDDTAAESCRWSETRVLGDIFEGSRLRRSRVLRLTGSWKEVGTRVDWLPGLTALTFEKNEYLRMLASFREDYEREGAPGSGA